MIIDLLKGAVSGNQVLSGGMTLMVVGGLLAYMRAVPTTIFNWIKDRLLLTVEVDGTDVSFPWLRAWLSEKGKSRFMCAGIAPREGTGDGGIFAADFKRQGPRFYLAPRGVCTFFHKGRLVIAWLSKEKVDHSREFRESITLRSMFVGRDFFKSIMHDAYEVACRGDKDEIQVWVPDGCEWRMLCKKPARSPESLILPDGVLESVIADAKKFLAEKSWYERNGIPHRRSYLFYGPPGTGKSSLAHVLASVLKMNVNMATFSQFYSDDNLTMCLSKVPSQNILVLEDVDAAQRKVEKGPSFSSFLNALDSLSAQEGRILVMTTNHREKLDEALLRPGRADVQIYVGPATYGQARAMFMRFFPGDADHAESFAAAWEGKSMAAIQEHLLSNRDDAEAASRSPHISNEESLDCSACVLQL